jgi:hypothetical protein
MNYLDLLQINHLTLDNRENTIMSEMEYYCTLFDSNFLPLGLTMLESLKKQNKLSFIYVLCMDNETYLSLNKLKLNNIAIINLDEIESTYTELLNIKKTRNTSEYCWTLTPVLIYFTLQKFNLKRITYLDADLFFFSDPLIFISEMLENNKNVLITEHSYDPKYDQTEKCGNFCVQFMTFNNNNDGIKVLKWWKDKCIEWCFNRQEDGKFGDQKYLDSWPTIFSNEVHILSQKEKTLAPWNLNFLSKKFSKLNPVFYHFHGFRLFSKNHALLYNGYYINRKYKYIYNTYCKELTKNIYLMNDNNIKFYPSIEKPNIRKKISNLRWKLFGKYKEAFL